MKLLFSLIFLLVTSVAGLAQTNFTAVMVDSNSVVQRPTNFLSINRILTFDTNFNVVYTNTNTLTFTNALGFGTNSVAAIRTNLGLGLPALTNTSNVTMMRALAGSTNTNEPFTGTISFQDYSDNTISIFVSNGIVTGFSN